ncbi:calmodulin-like protein 7 [Gossypium raimondii]|uniref:EF-hand domain-containing protein n=1 Tax=Gossypium raimondii TaxID=29730 RepID=A0A0D2USY7_GOSRA|nr:calmodulin-like protein 7 [Gossypium raimondii]KJB71784.1 hypothetical protein B456_011G142200 [Gossypium raimondii]MBA0599763.1 hypothetical protein [Gossypium raimondii]
MPTFLFRIFLLYNLLLDYLVPRKLKSFLSPSCTTTTPFVSVGGETEKNPSPAVALASVSPRCPLKRMDAAELKRVFQLFDKNGDGTISKKELNDSLENMGICIPDPELTQMIEKIDVNGDKCIDIDEFSELYRSIMDNKDEEEDMKEAFNVFDQNGDGYISVEELRSVLESLGIKQGKGIEDCKRMITKVDVDGDGRVNFMEFKQMMKGGGFTAMA